MNHETKVSPIPRKPYEQFGLTDKEFLFWRVNQERFEEIINDEATLIHDIQESSNNYGEFLFVKTSRTGNHGRICMTFYGLGYHEHRERWITREWFWYQGNSDPALLSKRIEKEEAHELLKKRQESIQPQISSDTQTYRGRLFEVLADLTDEDGALAEMEDMDELPDLF